MIIISKRLSLLAVLFFVQLTLTSCSSYNIQEHYKELSNNQKKINIALLRCYIEGNDRQSPKLQKACNDFMPKFGDYLEGSGYFSVNTMTLPLDKFKINEYSEFSSLKSEMYKHIKNSSSIDFSIYGITEVGIAGVNDKFCLVFVDMNNYEEHMACDKTVYLIDGTDGNYHLDAGKWDLVSNYIKNRSMEEMESIFKSRLK